MSCDLEIIRARIAGTEADLAHAKGAGDAARKARVGALLTEQQRKKNLLLAAELAQTTLAKPADGRTPYGLYGFVLAGTGIYARLTYKNYLLVKEQDLLLKDIIAGRFPFTEAELRGADQYVKRYGRTPRTWLWMYPLSFVAYKCVQCGPRFWLWGKQSNN